MGRDRWAAVLLITWYVLLMTSSPGGGVALRDGFDAKRLYDDMLKKSKYNRLIRPVSNESDSLVVRVGLRLTSIIDVVSIIVIHCVSKNFPLCYCPNIACISLVLPISKFLILAQSDPSLGRWHLGTCRLRALRPKEAPRYDGDRRNGQWID